MQLAPLRPRVGSLLAAALVLTCLPSGMSLADTVPQEDSGHRGAASRTINRSNQQPVISVELNQIWGSTPLEVEATVTVVDREEDRLRCAVRFDFDNDINIAQRMPTTFPNGSPQISVRRHTYQEGDGVRHIRVFCRDFNNRNGISTADAYVTLNPCDGNGFNACGTCGDLPDLPCAAGDAQCQAQVARVCVPACGDDSVTGNEVCDGSIVLGENCASMGLGRGRLVCTRDCQGFDAAGCTQAPSCPDSFPAPAPHVRVPDPPDVVSAAAEGCRAIRVAWSYNISAQSSSGSVPGLSEFAVYRDGQPIVETPGRETCSRKRGERAFVDDQVESGMTYTYEVAALNNLGQASARVGQVTVTVPQANATECGDTIAPPTPVNLRRLDAATDCRDTRIAVDGVTDVGAGVRGYRYYLDGADQCIEISDHHVSGGLRLQYSRGLHPGASYEVQVSAVDHAGNESPLSEPLTLEVAECARPSEFKTVVVLATYPDMPPPPMTPAEVAESVFGPVGSLRAFYEENSQSTVAITPGPGGGVTEWLMLPHDRLHYCDQVQDSTPFGVGAYCDFGMLRADVDALLGDRIDFSEIDRAVYAFYGSGGANSAVNVPFGESGLHMSTLVHETAHAWANRQHARGLTCPPGHQVPPDPTDFVLGCVLSEYGDGFDPMGSGSGHFSAHNKIEMGLLGTDALGFAHRSAFYPVQQLALPSDGLKEIRIPLGDDDFKDPAYSFEYRRPDGWDAGLGVDGVIVRIVGPDLQRNLRTLKQNGQIQQVILNPGEPPFVDPYRNIQVKVHSKNADRAILHVCRD